MLWSKDHPVTFHVWDDVAKDKFCQYMPILRNIMKATVVDDGWSDV